MIYKHTDIDIPFFIDLVKRAGEGMLEIYEQNFLVEKKMDRSPITLADKLTNDFLLFEISERYPGSKFISEEEEVPPYQERQQWQSFWLIDPLDGTKEFIKKNGEFTINIALIEQGEPTFGIVCAPSLGKLYYGLQGKGSYKVLEFLEKPLVPGTTSYKQLEKVRVAASRSNFNEATLEFINELKQKGKSIEVISMGSSLKCCMVAAGGADVYPRFGPTMEWDTAAAHAILRFAGKDLYDTETLLPLRYNKIDLRNSSFIAA